jgi:hypothetical protein
MAEKNKTAVDLGQLGGKVRAERLSTDELLKIAMKGVKARKAKLSPKCREEIAQKAAAARWSHDSKSL